MAVSRTSLKYLELWKSTFTSHIQKTFQHLLWPDTVFSYLCLINCSLEQSSYLIWPRRMDTRREISDLLDYTELGRFKKSRDASAL